MQTISFAFLDSASDTEQDLVLAKLSNWQELIFVGRIKPDSKNPIVLRMCYAQVKDGVDADALALRLSALPEIYYASVESKPWLAI